MRNLIITFAGAVLLAACAQKGPYTPPNTPHGKLKSISYLPYYGAPVDPQLQLKLSQNWAEYWAEVYPGVEWTNSMMSTQRLMKADLLKNWSEAEKGFMQTGILDAALAREMCAALGTEGFMQVTLFSAEGGIARSSIWALFKEPGKPSAARMAVVVYSCETRMPVWRAADELNYSSGYSHGQMVEYVHSAVAGKLWEK